MMHAFLDIVAWISACGVVFRFRKYFGLHRAYFRPGGVRSLTVSIIIPARNEADNLPDLLVSLSQMRVKPREIIVVDDDSVDDTAGVARGLGARVIPAGKKPEGWAGKTWACHVGAVEASGDVLLFTDADTRHAPDSLGNALLYLSAMNADMLSAPSFHRNELWWEKLLGPFHCLIHCGASPYDKQTTENAYAVGQYILITREAYRKSGGHWSVRSAIAEDTGLARSVMTGGGRYILYQGVRLFSVQMYSTFQSFSRGWVRLLRLGMRELSVSLSFNAVLPLLAFNFWNLYPPSWVSYAPVVVTLICFAMAQRRIGKFSLWGVLLFPLSVLLFLTLSSLAVANELLAIPICWKGRAYPTVTGQ